jgi:hypothetical protein
MSSLAAARADNFYHPPDWDPRKQSRAAFHEATSNPAGPAWKAHPLRERAKKLDQGILTIRFEMPFNVRCTGCHNQIGKGVRFNAEKKAIGKYFSTKVKCPQHIANALATLPPPTSHAHRLSPAFRPPLLADLVLPDALSLRG